MTRPIAQLVELLSYKQVVVGSNPAGPILVHLGDSPRYINIIRKLSIFHSCYTIRYSTSYISNFLGGFPMAASYLPSILVPLVGLVFPAIAMASLFLYIEKEEIA